MRIPSRPRTRRGFAVLMAVLCVAVLTLISGAVLSMVARTRQRLEADERELQAVWLADAGFERAVARLAADRTYSGEPWAVAADRLAGPDGATLEIAVAVIENAPARRRVRVQAVYPATGTLRKQVNKTWVVDLARLGVVEK